MGPLPKRPGRYDITVAGTDFLMGIVADAYEAKVDVEFKPS